MLLYCHNSCYLYMTLDPRLPIMITDISISPIEARHICHKSKKTFLLVYNFIVIILVGYMMDT